MGLMLGDPAAVAPPAAAIEALRYHLKQRLGARQFRTLGEDLYGRTGRILLRGSEEQPSRFWFGSILLTGLHVLIGTLLIALDGVDVMRRMLIGGGLGVLLAHVGVVLYTLEYQQILRLIREDLADVLADPEDLVDLERWIAAVCRRRTIALFAIAFAIPFSIVNTQLFQSVMSLEVGVGMALSTFLAGLVAAIPLYYLLALVLFPIRISRYDMHLFQVKPGSATLVRRLSSVLNGSLLLIAAYAAALTLLMGYLGFLRTAGVAQLAYIWGPLIGLFVSNQLALRRIIGRAKWGTLAALQHRIDGLVDAGELENKEQIETINRLLDMHDRVEASRSTALDLRAMLSFVNSLLLPLIAFILSNLETFGRLVR